MAIIPKSNLSGLPQITKQDFENNDPERLNRTLRLLASQVQAVQVGKASSTGVTNAAATKPTATVSGGGGGGGGGTVPISKEAVTIQGTHEQRLSTYLPASEDAGTYYYETDRTVTYLNFLAPSTVQVWQYVSGQMIAPIAQQPGDLTPYDTGFLFYATDSEILYYWSGTAWLEESTIGVLLYDTHAHRLTNYPSVSFPVATPFFESDRRLLYIVENSTGTVTVTSGTHVAYVSGNHFINSGSGFNAAQWPVGTVITINGVATTIASVTNDTALVLQTAVTNAAGVSYTVASGRWVYATGEYSAAYASLPTDLGEADSNAVFIDNATFYRSWTWTGAAWLYTVGQPPFAAVTVALGSVPDPGWHALDGSSVTLSTSAAGTTLVTLPAPAGTFLEFGTTYTGSTLAPVVGTIAPYTPGGSVSSVFSGVGSGNVSIAQGTLAAASAAPPFTPSGSVSSSFTGTPATLTITNEGTPPAIVFVGWVKL